MAQFIEYNIKMDKLKNSKQTDLPSFQIMNYVSIIKEDEYNENTGYINHRESAR